MNEVRSKVEGIIRVEENRQRIAKSTAIAVTQNNVADNSSKFQETKRKLKEKQQRPGGKANQKRKFVEGQRNDYNCNPSKRYKPKEESFDYNFTIPQEKSFA